MAEDKTDGYVVFYSDNALSARQQAMTHLQTQQQPVPLVRPTIAASKWAMGVGVPLLLYAASVAVCVWLNGVYVWIGIGMCAVTALLTVRFSVELAVLLYQRLAPERLRRCCVFEPTCSQYMLLAIEKHGFFKGCCKGVGRLCRCRYPNGGTDLP